AARVVAGRKPPFADRARSGQGRPDHSRERSEPAVIHDPPFRQHSSMALKKASTGWAWVTWEETSTFLARPIFEPPRHCDADRAWGTSSTGRDIIPRPYSARRRGRLLRGEVVDTAAMAESRVAKVLRRAASRYADHLAGALGDRLVAVVLFGSVARGDAGAGSDVDLLIVARDLPEGQFARKGLL